MINICSTECSRSSDCHEDGNSKYCNGVAYMGTVESVIFAKRVVLDSQSSSTSKFPIGWRGDKLAFGPWAHGARAPLPTAPLKYKREEKIEKSYHKQQLKNTAT